MKTKIGRLLTVLLILSTSTSIILAYVSKPKWPPYDHYYFTLKDPQIDLRLSPELALVRSAPIDLSDRESVFLKRCDVTRRQDASYPFMAYRHDIVLCNSTGQLSGARFDLAFAQFRKLVDGMYLEFQVKTASHFAAYLMIALLFVAVCWASIATVNWISRGS